MTAKMGRPPKGEESRTVKMNLRLSKAESQKIQDCADKLEVSRTDAIMRGIDLLTDKLKKE